MKRAVKIYHILQTQIDRSKGKKSQSYVDGYKAALLDTLTTDTAINKGHLDFSPQQGIINALKPKQ
jgi:hypothetical protein|tara:strand:- start:3134 stop:3331 length:198 start_codon:yes stop_codon:yes gene_type:complete